jgi:hypothetical protein
MTPFGTWLAEIGLGRYDVVFVSNGIDFDVPRRALHGMQDAARMHSTVPGSECPSFARSAPIPIKRRSGQLSLPAAQTARSCYPFFGRPRFFPAPQSGMTAADPI